MASASGPTQADFLRHKQSNALVVRLEDELAEILGCGWSSPHDHDAAAAERVCAALRDAIAERDKTQRALFPRLTET